jgi:TatA/E family protein of Tat protein translocase
MWGLSIEHWVIVIAVVVVLFGKNQISSLMKDIGGGLREGRRAVQELISTNPENKSDA